MSIDYNLAFETLIDRINKSATALELATEEAFEMTMSDVYDIVSTQSQNDLERIAEEAARIKLGNE